MILLILILIFVASCIALGYLAGLLVRKRKWPGWSSGLMCFTIALLWPIFLVGQAMYSAGHYQRQSPSDPGDAPAYVLMGVFLFGVPFLFIVGLPLALLGAHLARRVSVEDKRAGDGAA